MSILPIFCDIDDLCLLFESAWHRRLLRSGSAPQQAWRFSPPSEVMTLLVLFHASGYRDLKTFYTQHAQKHLAWALPKLTSYSGFVELQRDALIPLWCYLHTRFGQCTGASFVDATLAVCHNLHIPSHKVLRGLPAARAEPLDWLLRLLAPLGHQRPRGTALVLPDAG